MPDVDYYMELPYHIKWDADFSNWTKDHHEVSLTCWLVEMPYVQGTGIHPDAALDDLRHSLRCSIEQALMDGDAIPYPLDGDVV